MRLLTWFIIFPILLYGVYRLNAAWIQNHGSSLIESDIRKLPGQVILVVPGAGKAYSERPNYQFNGRVKTAALLYRTLDPEFIILSGYHDGGEYSETVDLARALSAEGVNPKLFIYDSTAHDTFQTILNLQRFAGNRSLVITSQKEHLSRLLWLADQCNLSVTGYVADGWPRGTPGYIQTRERMACIKASFDVLLFAITGKRIAGTDKPAAV